MKLVGGNAEGLEDGEEDKFVVFCAVGDELKWGLQVIEERVYI